MLFNEKEEMLESDGRGFNSDSVTHICSFTLDNNLNSLRPAFLFIKMDIPF